MPEGKSMIILACLVLLVFDDMQQKSDLLSILPTPPQTKVLGVTRVRSTLWTREKRKGGLRVEVWMGVSMATT